MLKISHRFVLPLLGVIVNKDEMKLLLPYMRSGDLSKRIKKNRVLAEDVAKFYLFQLIEAVHHLHRNGIIHRDLKPTNVLMKSDRKFSIIQLSDFGMSKQIDDDLTESSNRGTTYYMAKEVKDGKNGFL